MVFIGTSGWVYKDWQKHFYPADIPARLHFQFYALTFPTVEINATFYRLHTLSMVKGWRDKAPPGFVFAVKGSRYITHIKRLNELGGSLNVYMRRITPMKDRLGPILWQLPPSFKKDLPRLEAFLKRLPKTFCHAVEFRNPSWYEGDEAMELLHKYNTAHVSLSSQRMSMNLSVTADFIYIRFHGLEGGAAHDYKREELEPWAAFIREQAVAGRNVYAYFNNDVNVHAPDNAQMLMEMVGKYAARPVPGQKVQNDKIPTQRAKSL